MQESKIQSAVIFAMKCGSSRAGALDMLNQISSFVDRRNKTQEVFLV